MFLHVSPVRRRRFIRFLGGILAVPLLAITGKAVRITGLQHEKDRLILPSVPEGISFHGAVITIREGEKIRVLSSRCTHLGCQIQTLTNGHFQCPCHGSEFSMGGQVLKGPADKPLKALWFKTDPSTGRLTIYLNREV